MLGLLLASSCRNEGVSAPSLSTENGAPAPDFTLKDISGAETRLSAFKGRVVLLEFWATWCPPCKASVPDLIGLQKKYEDRGFTVVGVSMDGDADAAAQVKEFSDKQGISYPLLIADETVIHQYNVMSIPTSFLINKDGKIVSSHNGYSDDFARRVSSEIEKLL